MMASSSYPRSRLRRADWSRTWRARYCSGFCRILNIDLPRGQRNGLRVVCQHVLHFHGTWSDVHDLVAPVDNVAFLREEDVFALQQEDALVAVLRSLITVEFQIDRRRRRWRRRALIRQRRVCGAWNRCRRRRSFGTEDVATGPFIRYVF